MSSTPTKAYDQWLANLTPDTIRQMFLDRGCTQVMIKRLSDRQDNDKNQIYMAPDLTDLTWIPSGDVVGSRTRSNKPGAPGTTKFTAPVNFAWIAPRGDSPAPEAKLIYYPQYPEVRFSGLMLRSPDAPRSLYARKARGQEAGRQLLIGTSPTSKRVWAMILPPEAIAGPRIDELASDNAYGVFHLWRLSSTRELGSTRDKLLAQLRHIHDLGWVPGQILRVDGPEPYTAKNAAGYTLEALCGVLPNSAGEPDYLDWELKAHTGGNNITLFTPAPTDGLIRSIPRADFMWHFGRFKPAVGIEPDRWDFTGLHRVGSTNASTGLELAIDGWDGRKRVEPDGGIQLTAADGREVARWGFERLMNLWKTKHANTSYVPYQRRTVPGGAEYSFADRVFLCSGTSFLHLLRGFAAPTVVYDPGLNIKWEQGARGFRWKPHDRHQFRSNLNNVGPLYDDAHWVDLPIT